MRICVIFNPTAKGEKAKRFRRNLDLIAANCALKQTVAAGGARPLATQAVNEGFDTVVAAGGDGTLNEVLNGIGDAKDGFARARLGVLPLGTVNVFARELGFSMNLRRDWETLLAGRESVIDLGKVECMVEGTQQARYFAQLAGAGLDARAIDLVDWRMKKKIGPLAYVLAGLKALGETPSQITTTNGSTSATGELILLGNGRLYGGNFQVFPDANLRDGLLEVRVIRRTNWLTLVRCGISLLTTGRLPRSVGECSRVEKLMLTSPATTRLELDGESVGELPATFSIERNRLRVLIP